MANAPGLRFTDSTTTVTISDGSTGWLLKYDANSKAADEPLVTEQPKTLLLGGISTVRGTIESLNKLFRQAKTYQTEKTGPVVYVERLTESSGAWWRSELVLANPIPEPSVMDAGIITGKFEIAITYTRKNYWEGAEAQLPLTNGNGTNNTTGLTVYNHDDSTSGHDNYVSIVAADVAGDLPGPVRLEMTNSLAASYIWTLWLGHNWTDPANFGHILEAESAIGGTIYADSYCSGGYYSSIALASGAEAELFSWTLASAAQVAAAGRWYKPLVRFRVGATGDGMINDTVGTNLVNYRIKIKSGTQIIYTSAYVYKTGELSAIRIPPQLFRQSGLRDISLVLCGKQTTGSSKTIDVDFMMLQPLDGWRKIVFPYNYIANTYRLIDDGFYGDVYGDTGAGSGKIPASGIYGAPIMLEPGKIQRLYFLWAMNYVNSHQPAMTATIKLYYRPRKLTLN